MRKYLELKRDLINRKQSNCLQKPPNMFQKFTKKCIKSTQNALSMYKKTKDMIFQDNTPKMSQVRIRDLYKNLPGMKMRPCQKKKVKMIAKTTNYLLKKYFKGLQNVSECIIITINEIHHIVGQ